MKRIRIALAVMAVVGLMVVASAQTASAGGGCHSGATEATGTSVGMKDACFSPTVLHIRPGQTVTWTNLDDMPHAVGGQSGSWGTFDEMKKGDQLSYRFTEAGVFPYACHFHPGMNGVVVVGKVKAPAGTVSSGGGVAAVPQLPSPEPAKALPSAAAAVRPVVESATPWKIAAGVGFGLFVATLATLGFLARPRRRKTVAVVA